MKKLILVFTATLFLWVTAQSQTVLDTDEIRAKNSIHPKEHYPNKKVQPYPSLREADVMWSRTIWREIDLREKINHPFYYPENDGMEHTIEDRQSLIDVIYHAIQSTDFDKSITAYGNPIKDDEFTQPMTREEAKRIGGAGLQKKRVPDWNARNLGEDDAMKDTTFDVPFNRNLVTKWRIKEIWYFDKQASVMGVRIVGLCPLMRKFEGGKWEGGYTPLFWVRFKEARKILVNAEAFNLMKNDAERRTYDDIFWKRMFNSVIIKEANVMDRKVNSYMIGLDALLEAERIKAEIFNIEHDLWEY